jgi:phosphate uptake regulator
MKSKEVRRLIKFGDSSHVVSIPKDWIEKNKLQKGDLIFLDENEFGQLLISPDQKKIERVDRGISVCIDKKNEAQIKREIIASYLKNFSTIRLHGSEIRKKLPFIKETIQNLMAMEIVKQSNEEVVAKVFVDTETIKFEEITTRIDLMVRSLFQDFCCLLEKENIQEKELEEMVSRDEDVNGLFFLSQKLFKQKLENPFLVSTVKLADLFESWNTNFRLEFLSDRIKEMSTLIKKNKLNKNKAIVKSLKNIFKEIEFYYLSVMKARHARDINIAFELSSKKVDLYKKCDFLVEKSGDKKGFPEICEKTRSVVREIHAINRSIYNN